MKNFFTSMLGALVALIVFTLGGGLLMLGLIGAMAALGEKQVAVEKGSYLVFDLSSAITDAPPVIDFRALGSDHKPTLQLRTVTRTLRAAAKDDRIAGIFIFGDVPAGGPGYGALKEVRAALNQFKASGKPVKAYLTYATTKNYYLASVADELTIDPYGTIIMPGLASQPMFLAGAFEKYGIGVQVTRVGKYKSAVEPFTRTDMSPENRAQIQKLLDDVWAGLLRDMAGSRKLKSNAIQATVDAEGLIRADAAKAANLVDRIAYRDEIIGELKRITGRDNSKESFKQIGLVDYSKVAKDQPPPLRTMKPADRVEELAKTEGDASAKPAVATKTPDAAAQKTSPAAKKAEAPAVAVKDDDDQVRRSSRSGRVAVVYAEGDIVDGEGNEQGEIGGTRFSRELRRLRQDDSVKAIVLRVNSPGGSASASETIQREIRLAREVKPVIVSMGSYAASGGYWISAYGDRIFAEPTTVTGSIGVFGIMFDVQKLFNGWGLTFDSVKTGRFADTLTIARPKTPEEMALFQRSVDWIYDQFVSKVVEGRHLAREHVEEIAQGRVWSGVEAKKLGLVDELGGLDAAIRYAAGRAGLGSDYRLVEYPRKKEFAEALQEVFEKMAPNSARASGVVGQVVQRVESELRVLGTFNDPQGVYARLPENLMIQ
ncbi:signal peptide peptidase SppA [Opitutus terrae]|uniref:Signal peptide peptidase SppA, 67K type n=1 Tax=Opitutus terrae (strain DSM 11246 / JCM 15787 / PB90-1) TaxID=452637 RepID=B1ZZ79_OPITP|nr:signal peptide peptidase SppA [Opitutus terrae]ACB77151.1 signal peptide peptidase SppA, 67K type [Opitutus terrae PB90-1]